jgi:hypothetical protein
MTMRVPMARRSLDPIAGGVNGRTRRSAPDELLCGELNIMNLIGGHSGKRPGRQAAATAPRHRFGWRSSTDGGSLSGSRAAIRTRSGKGRSRGVRLLRGRTPRRPNRISNRGGSVRGGKRTPHRIAVSARILQRPPRSPCGLSCEVSYSLRLPGRPWSGHFVRLGSVPDTWHGR